MLSGTGMSAQSYVVPRTSLSFISPSSHWLFASLEKSANPVITIFEHTLNFKLLHTRTHRHLHGQINTYKPLYLDTRSTSSTTLSIRCVFPFVLPRFSLLHAGSACKCLLSFPSHITDSIQDVPLTIHPGHYRMAGPCHHNFGLMNHYTFGGTRPLVLAERSKLIISCFDLAVKRPYCCEFVPANMFSFYSECLHPPTAIETSPGRLSYCSTIPRINSFIHIHILQIIRSV